MKLKHTKTQKLLEVLGIVMLAAIVIFVALKWRHIPELIPGHYNALGEADRWGSRNEVIFLPALSAFLYGLITLVTLFPSACNMPVKISEENKTAAYTEAKNLLIIMKLEMLIIFGFMTYRMANAAPLPWWFLPGVLVMMTASVIVFVRRTLRASRKGES